MHKYVVSSTITDPEWENSTVLSGPLVEEITQLKDQPGRDIVTTGSITLVHSLIAENLVDEYRLFVYPTVVGTGARLFEDATVGARPGAGRQPDLPVRRRAADLPGAHAVEVRLDEILGRQCPTDQDHRGLT